MKYLLCVDDGAEAASAAGCAFKLVMPGDHLLILHVTEPADPLTVPIEWSCVQVYNPSASVAEKDTVQETEEGKAVLKHYGDLANANQVPHTLLIGCGSVSKAVKEETRVRGVDLVIMGRRAMGAVQRALLGSWSAEVLREAACPVLLVTAPVHGYCQASTKFLVAIDQSKSAEEAFRFALRLAMHRKEMHVILMNVVQDRPSFIPIEPFVPEPEAFEGSADLDEEKHEQEASFALLGKYASIAANQKIPCTTISARGVVATEVAREAQLHGVDVVIVGQGGANALQRALLGSVSEAILKAVRCPLLVVKSIKS